MDWILLKHSNIKSYKQGGSVCPDKWLSPHRTGGSAAQEYSFKPYIIITPEQGVAFAEFEKVEKKIAMESMRHEAVAGYDETTEGYLGSEFLHEICSNVEEEDTINAYVVRIALKNLPEKQQRRFRLFFYYGYSETEIATIEGVSQPAIHDSIQAGLKKLKYMLNW